MKNTFGQNISVTLFGESHGAAIGAVIDGLTPGIPVSYESISHELTRRRPIEGVDTPRREKDDFSILSGVFNGKTTGTPICITIPNENVKSGDYVYGIARPSHADYSAFCKYHGFEDYRGGGHFSGRITAALCAVGGILLPMLDSFGIKIGTHILECGGVHDDEFRDFENEITALRASDFPTISASCGEKMLDKIRDAKNDSDSIGGIIQTAVYGLLPGLGEPWFDSVEGLISHAVFGIGGIKGIEFGRGFDFARGKGSECNDEFSASNGKVITTTNANGGINGGITNGMPIVFNCAVKPTPSIAKPQKTVDFTRPENTELTIKGRHDPAIIRRICPVTDSICAIVISDLIAGRYGTDIFLEGRKKCSSD